jgi:aquaporin Z
MGTTATFILGPTSGHSLWQAGLAELCYTFMLCFVVLNVACSKVHANKNQYYGLAIGFVIVAGAYSGGSVSMGCFNPAVAIGIRGATWWMPLVYWLFEFAGAAVAAGLFFVCRPEELDKTKEEGMSKPEYDTVPRLVSEFLGTFMLVLTVGLNVLSGSPAGAFSIAAVLMSMIFALGSCSGAHFNPAVTVAILCSGRGKITLKDAGAYIGVQILAGITAAFTYSLMMNGQTFALKPEAYTWHESLIAELVFTFVLAFVVLSVATVKDDLKDYFGFAIGMCVTVGGFAIGKVSGGSLNPAVSIGISTAHIMGGGLFFPCLIYTVVELAGGALAAGAFMVTQPSEYTTKEQAEKKDPDETTHLISNKA